MQRIKRRIYTYDEVGIYHARSVQCVDDKKDIKICHVNYDNINDALSFQSKQYIKCFKEFLDNGDIGYYAYLGGECVHRTWTKSNGVAAIHAFYTIPLSSNQIFIHWCETASSARGHSIYPKVLHRVCNEHPSYEILIAVNENNLASRRGVEKAGFIIKERIKVLVVLGIKHIKVENIIPNVHSGGDKGAEIIYCGVLFVPQRSYVEVAA